MLKRIVEETLSDGSSVYNLIINDSTINQQMTLHCPDMQAITKLDKVLEELTLDFPQIKTPITLKVERDQLNAIIRLIGASNIKEMRDKGLDEIEINNVLDFFYENNKR